MKQEKVVLFISIVNLFNYYTTENFLVKWNKKILNFLVLSLIPSIRAQ